MSELAPQTETQTQTQRYRIGYALKPKKIHDLIRTSLIDHAKERGIDLIQIDITKPLIQQGPFHCIIHKLHSEEWKELHLDEYMTKNPNGVTIIDPPELVKKLHNRVSMLDCMTQLRISLENATVGVPNQMVVDQTKKGNGNEIRETITGLNMSFPVIAKPFHVDGTAKSHELCLVFDVEGLQTTLELNKNTPLVLQEFVNHGGVVFKVYVAGEHVKCVKRKSLPDISKEKAKTLKGTLKFSQISNLTVQESGHNNNNEGGGVDGDDGGLSNIIEKAEMPPESMIRGLARSLRKAMGLNLFNVDVIRDDSKDDCTRYLVIDINYCPGYAKLPCYEPFFTDFLLDYVPSKAVEVGENGNEII